MIRGVNVFKWIAEIDEPPFKSNRENGDLSIKRMNSLTELNGMSTVCQFFATFDVILDTNSLISIPTPNDKALETVMNEIVPHFSEVKQIFINGKLKAINVRCLKIESKKIVQDLLLNGVYPVMPDLFRTKHLNLATERRVLKRYLVNQELIEPLSIKETEEIREFFSNSFFTERGSIAVQPTGWTLEDHLQQSVTIRAFSTFAKHIVLVVDDKDMSVVLLEIGG